jgi:hypothetical protein
MHKSIILFVFLFLIACREDRGNNFQNDTTQSPLNQNDVSNNNEVSSSIDRSSNKIILKNIVGCAYNRSSINESLDVQDPGHRAVDQIKLILKYSGLPSNFQVYSADIDNAIATLINNERYIIFDNKLLNYTDKASNNYWASMSILAHEIGHHLSGHTLGYKVSNHNAELQADKFSGFVLYKLGATIEQAQYAMKLLASNVDSESHPALNKRLDAIKLGWSEANETRYESAIPPPPNDDFSHSYNPSEFSTYELIGVHPNEIESHDFELAFYQGEHEGVILDGKLDYDGGVLTILVTKLDSKNESSEYPVCKKNGKYEFTVSTFDNNMSRVHYNNLFALMVPGRRITFSYLVAGSAGSKTIVSVKPTI